MSHIDLAAVRARLASSAGKTYWRSLEELANTDEFQDYLHREFPSQASEFTDPVGRRQFLRLMGASLALAGAGACTRQPAEEIVPYVQAPEQIVPGRPLFFATAMSLDGFGTGLLVENHMGRPTKIEGNPDHPASLGSTDAYAQASILTLYDPDRSQTITHLEDVRPWGELLGAIQTAMVEQRGRQGAGLRILTGTITSPTLADQIRGILRAFPQAKWHQYDPVTRDAERAGARLAFGTDVGTHYQVDRADVIVSLDADLLAHGPGHVRYARQFAARRRVEDPTARMNRLYVVESTPTATSAMADHRLALRPSEIQAFAAALAAALGVTSAAAADASALSETVRVKWLPALVEDLRTHRGTSLIVAGPGQSAPVHALVHAMNAALGNAGATVIYTDPIEANPVNQHASLGELAEDLEANRVELLLIAGGNAAYTAPADLRFGERLRQSNALRIHLGLYRDETAELCQWHVPEAHFLETWSDLRSFDGTVSICQPLIAPLYGGRSAHELLATLTPRPDRSGADIVREFWQRAFTDRTGAFGPLIDAQGAAFADFDRFWRRALHDGVIAGSALPPRTFTAARAWSAPSPAVPSPAGNKGFEIIFRPDPSVYDGQFANNGWLQELPKQITKITWENAALISPRTAQDLHVQSGSYVDVAYAGRTVRAPVWVTPGHANQAITLHLGYGRQRAGRVGTGIGYNAYLVRTSEAPAFGIGATITPTGDRTDLAATQLHHTMEGRHLVRSGTVTQLRDHPEFVHELGHVPDRTTTLYPDIAYTGHAWGMVIDLNTCNGCNACMVACQSENNIPVVGKDQVLRGREMHWIRVDRYYEGDIDAPETFHQPVPCMQCEHAPCEVVCPVAATTHSSEGLNDMVYNRCIGTRYCSNNCPYKVRRFNFLLYQDFTTPVLKMARNPDVTVRSRGVMEKCTYCVQRINAVRIDAERDRRPIKDGDIVPACAGACPSEAIVFGDINDPQSRVARLKASHRNYGLLEDLNTRPRTTYLAAIKNPNPGLAGTKEHG